MRLITVTPANRGWEVRSDAIDNDMVFQSGARAEEAARRLGQALAETGEFVQVEVRLRNGERAGRFVCVPPSLLSQDVASSAPRTLEAVCPRVRRPAEPGADGWAVPRRRRPTVPGQPVSQRLRRFPPRLRRSGD